MPMTMARESVKPVMLAPVFQRRLSTIDTTGSIIYNTTDFIGRRSCEWQHFRSRLIPSRVGIAHEIYYIRRPFLSDPDDDMIPEVAVVSGSDAIVTFNEHDFRGCEQFGLRLLTPAKLLQEIGVLK